MTEPESATDVAAAVRAGRVTATWAVERALARIAERDGPVNAYTVVLDGRARAAAAGIDRRVAAGEDPGPLAGVPVSVKDHVWLAGERSTNGSRALAGFVAPATAVCVERLAAAGAVVVGRTNNPEFCYRGTTSNEVWGTTRNPHDLSRTCGGSSGGAAVSVATGTVPLAVGTDGGGSIRIPSAFCGTVGLKPTFGLVPKLPGFRGWPTLSVDGPIAAEVADLALATAVMRGPAAADPLTFPGPRDDLPGLTRQPSLPGLRVAVSPDLGFAPVDDDVLAAFAATVERLRAAGAQLVPSAPDTGDPGPLWDAIALPEGHASEGPLVAQHPQLVGPDAAAIVAAGASVTAQQYLDAQDRRGAYTRAWEEFFADVDVLVCPTLPCTAFAADRAGPARLAGRDVPDGFDAWCALCLPANLTGQPAASVPAGVGADGLPVGVQVIGPRWADGRVLAAAAALHALTRQPP